MDGIAHEIFEKYGESHTDRYRSNFSEMIFVPRNFRLLCLRLQGCLYENDDKEKISRSQNQKLEIS